MQLFRMLHSVGKMLESLARNSSAAMLFLLAAVSVAAAEGEKIDEVRIAGNRRIETEAIRSVVVLKPGALLFNDRVDKDVRAIFKLGHFIDVKAETATTDKGLTLTYSVVEKPVLRDIKIEGNKELSVEKIREVLEVRVNTIFSAKDLAKSIAKVKKLYADEGYYLAEVDGVANKRSETEEQLVIKITEGKKVLIEEIRFEGNKTFSRRKLKGVMETTENWWLAWLTGAGVYKEELLKNDVNLLVDFYMNNGYVNVKIAEPRVELLPDRKGLVVVIAVTEGDQYAVGMLGFRGDLLDTQEELTKILKLKTGETFSRGTLRTDVFSLTDHYADKGYAFTNVNPVTRLNHDRKNIDITFDMEKGDKVYFDRISIAGNPKTRDKVVRRELKVFEGELYSATGLKKSKQNLMNLGFFEDVTLATERGGAENKLNLNIGVKEKPTGTFSVGAGYSSLDGIIGQGSVQQGNFLGLGLKANASASLGGKSSTYSVGVLDPYFLDSRWNLGGDIYRTEREYTDYTRRATGGDIKAGYPLSDTLSTFWIYRYEDKKIFNESVAFKASDEFKYYQKTSTNSSITGSLTRNTTDYRLDPTTGMINNLSVEFAGLGGTNYYSRYIGSTTYFHPVVWGTVFSLKGELGYIQAYGGHTLPIDEKFYLGGINTIRGYSNRSISPWTGGKNTPRFYVGGAAETVYNAELTIPLLKDAGLKGVVFFDAGNSYNHASELYSRMQMSYGGGIRWFSPIGPLRLEYGIPVNPRTGIDSGGKFEFSIGSFF